MEYSDLGLHSATCEEGREWHGRHKGQGAGAGTGMEATETAKGHVAGDRQQWEQAQGDKG